MQYNYVSPQLVCQNNEAVELVEDNTWFVVGIQVLLLLAATIYLGMSVWCVTKKRGKFTGKFSMKNGVSVQLECK